jgi:hypothetical protein
MTPTAMMSGEKGGVKVTTYFLGSSTLLSLHTVTYEQVLTVV